MKNENGFTIIEVLVYLALFSMLIGGSVLAAYYLIESSNHNQSRTQLAEEGNYLIGKINYVVSGVASVSLPAAGATGTNLSVTRVDTSIAQMALSGSDMTITETGVTLPLNSSVVKVSNLEFTNQTTSAGELIKSAFTLTTLTDDGKTVSEDFSSTKYLHK